MLANIPRPSHADFTYQEKYGIRVSSGGGRASARETASRVAAGAIAEKWLLDKFGIQIVAWVSAVGHLTLPRDLVSLGDITRDQVDATPVRCPNAELSDEMAQLILDAKEEQDSVGGIVSCVCRGVPTGWGEPCFDKLEALLAHAMLSIPASKGFDVGSGFDGVKMKGSEHNDLFGCDNGKLHTLTNNSGGIQGGISNGEQIVFRVAFKPPATISKTQITVNFDGEQVELNTPGRHDPCIVPRAVPIVEAMAALVLADMAMIQLSRQSSKWPDN